MYSVFFIFFSFVPFCLGMTPSKNVGKDFVINFDSNVYVCSDPDSEAFIDTTALESTRLNETTAVMSGSFTLIKGIAPDVMIEFVIMKDTGKSYETVATHEICDLCSELEPKDEETLYSGYLEYIGFPDSCPIEPGEYRIHDMKTDTSQMPINAANAGKYLVVVNFNRSPDGSCKNDLEFLGCIKLDLLVEPLD